MRLERIKTELKVPHQPVDKKLVKPPRGLIMYGPPGQLHILLDLFYSFQYKRYWQIGYIGEISEEVIGIIMVGPPLAAGELNRSLVGESERIIIALCSRSYQVPYAMSCI